MPFKKLLYAGQHLHGAVAGKVEFGGVSNRAAYQWRGRQQRQDTPVLAARPASASWRAGLQGSRESSKSSGLSGASGARPPSRQAAARTPAPQPRAATAGVLAVFSAACSAAAAGWPSGIPISTATWLSFKEAAKAAVSLPIASTASYTSTSPAGVAQPALVAVWPSTSPQDTPYGLISSSGATSVRRTGVLGVCGGPDVPAVPAVEATGFRSELLLPLMLLPLVLPPALRLLLPLSPFTPYPLQATPPQIARHTTAAAA